MNWGESDCGRGRKKPLRSAECCEFPGQRPFFLFLKFIPFFALSFSFFVDRVHFDSLRGTWDENGRGLTKENVIFLYAAAFFGYCCTAPSFSCFWRAKRSSLFNCSNFSRRFLLVIFFGPRRVFYVIGKFFWWPRERFKSNAPSLLSDPLALVSPPVSSSQTSKSIPFSLIWYSSKSCDLHSVRQKKNLLTPEHFFSFVCAFSFALYNSALCHGSFWTYPWTYIFPNIF